MKVYIDSNFYIHGMEQDESLDIQGDRLPLRNLLEHLSALSAEGVEYIRPGAQVVDREDWEVDINGIPYEECEDTLECELRDGDTVTIRRLAFFGG